MSDHHGEATGAEDRGRIGMWLFICTEILLFGGLFLLYSVYRYKHPGDFHDASLDLSRFAGTLNTRCSSRRASRPHWRSTNCAWGGRGGPGSSSGRHCCSP